MQYRPRSSPEFKRQVVEEWLSGVSTPAQLIRRHNLSSGLLYRWRNQYSKGRFNNPPSREAALEERVQQLEQLLGKVTLENEFLKKPFRKAFLKQEKRAFIAKHRHLLESTQRGCRLMNLPRSTYYYKAPSTPGDDHAIIGQIEAIIEHFPKYGYRRVSTGK